MDHLPASGQTPDSTPQSKQAASAFDDIKLELGIALLAIPVVLLLQAQLPQPWLQWGLLLSFSLGVSARIAWRVHRLLQRHRHDHES